MTGREYEKSHHWITFSLDLSRVRRYSLWMLLGAAQSKCLHLAGTPLLPDFAKEMYRVFLAKGVLATTAIEGNTLSEEEVRRHLEGKLKLPPSKQYLRQEIDNVIRACNEIAGEVLRAGFDSGGVRSGSEILCPEPGGLRPDPEISRSGSVGLCSDDVKRYNGWILEKLEVEEGVVPGAYRTHSTVVGNYRGAPAEDCPYLVDRLCQWLNELSDREKPLLGEHNRIASGVLAAILAHLYLVWIHPFGDGNGRTARLLEFRLLLEAGAPAPVAHLLSNHYNETRNDYYRRLHEASRKDTGVVDFIEYALQGLVDALDGQIDVVRAQQNKTIWINYVHERFRGKASTAASRQKSLVLAVTERDPQEGVDARDISGLTPRIAAGYAGKTPRTISRDLNVLYDMGLLRRGEDGRIRICLEVVSAFLPERKP